MMNLAKKIGQRAAKKMSSTQTKRGYLHFMFIIDFFVILFIDCLADEFGGVWSGRAVDIGFDEL